MIIQTDNAFILDSGLSQRSDYWGQGMHPEWAALKMMRHFPGQRTGAGVEPHYHDADEFWLFLSGRGEVWLDGICTPITPNTLVYTPMGAVHRFQMFTDFANVPSVTVLEREKRPIHILPEVHGPPTPTVPGFVIPGADNHGPFPNRGPRCPVGEMRQLTLEDGDRLIDHALARTEYWCVLDGMIQLTIDALDVQLSAGDLAILKQGGQRRLVAGSRSRVALARE